MTNTPAIVAAMLAKPITHKVVTTWTDGQVNVLEVRSLAQAENHKITMGHRVGRDIIRRETGETVRVVSIEIVKVAA
jgi:hypothetical protein